MRSGQGTVTLIIIQGVIQYLLTCWLSQVGCQRLVLARMRPQVLLQQLLSGSFIHLHASLPLFLHESACLADDRRLIIVMTCRFGSFHTAWHFASGCFRCGTPCSRSTADLQVGASQIKVTLLSHAGMYGSVGCSAITQSQTACLIPPITSCESMAGPGSSPTAPCQHL